MKVKFLVAIATLLAGLTASSVASATCVMGCVPQPMPTPSPTSTFSVDGTASFNGLGNARFVGQEGFAKVEKTGYSQVFIDMNAGGNLCGTTCQSGKFTFSGSAGEQVKAWGGAYSDKSGLPAMVTNSGSANAGVKFNFNK